MGFISAEHEHGHWVFDGQTEHDFIWRLGMFVVVVDRFYRAVLRSRADSLLSHVKGAIKKERMERKKNEKKRRKKEEEEEITHVGT